jgi:Cu(I)/Ag(I) efflux system periplasmic protein CusF
MKPRKRTHVLVVLFLATASIFGTGAQARSHGAGDTASIAMTEGEVKKINKETGKITIKHGPLANLDMPAMTMVFRVKEPAMLDQVQAGDKIKFIADKVNGAYTVTKIEPAT